MPYWDQSVVERIIGSHAAIPGWPRESLERETSEADRGEIEAGVGPAPIEAPWLNRSPNGSKKGEGPCRSERTRRS
jgi:hypothetical protein